MRLRCLKYFSQGALLIGPAPYHRDFQCWLKGNGFTCGAMLAAIVSTLVGVGFVAGRYF